MATCLQNHSTPPLTKRVVSLRDFLTFSEARSILMGGKADNLYDAT